MKPCWIGQLKSFHRPSGDCSTDRQKDGIDRQTLAVPASPPLPHPSAEAAAPLYERAMQGASALTHFKHLDGLRDGLLALDVVR